MKKRTRTLAILAAIAGILQTASLTAFADANYTEGTFGALTYQNHGTHIIITDCDEYAENVEIPSEIDGVPVTEIGDRAFHFCNLQTVTIPEGITRIGNFAFLNCDYLTELVIPDSVTEMGEQSVSQCESLAAVTLSENAPVLPYCFLSFCDKLESITIPEGVTTIETDALIGCDALTEITIPKTVTSIAAEGFHCDIEAIHVDAENTVYSSQDGVLFNKEQTKLLCYPTDKPSETYTIPDTVTAIDDAAFAGNLHLVRIAIPDTVNEIGAGAFYGSSALAEITLPSGITVLPETLFMACSALQSVTIPKTVTEIQEGVFTNCSAMTEILVEEGNPSYQSIDGALYDMAGTTLLKCPGGIKGRFIVPEGVTAIAEEAFAYSNITTAMLPDTVTEIGAYAFSNCSNLTHLVIPEGVQTLKYGTFFHCYKLETVRLPLSLTKVESISFYDTSDFDHVYYAGTQEDWNKITIQNENNYLQYNLELHFGEAPKGSVGDLNGDNVIDSVDSAALLQAAAEMGASGNSVLTAEQRTFADVNGSGNFDAEDSAWILQYAVYCGAGGTEDIFSYQKNRQ